MTEKTSIITKDVILSWYVRFGIGSFSAIIIPAVNMSQNPIDFGVITFMVALGTCIPYFILALVTGLYAVVIERKETDMMRLFRICIAMPTVVIALASGKPIKADEIEVKCVPKNQLAQSIVASFDSMTGKARHRYYILSEKPTKSGKFIMIKDKDISGKWYIKKTTVLPKWGQPLYDFVECKIVIPPKKEKSDVQSK